MIRRTFTHTAAALALALISTLTAPARAQCPAGWVAGFASPGIASATPRCVVTLPGGDLVVSGSFTTAGGITVPKIVRYSPATNVWTPLGTGTTSSGTIYTIKVLPNGDLLAGGNYSQIGGTTASRIARYSFATNTWSPLGAGLTGGGAVYAIAVLPGGDYIVGGLITQVAGINLQHIARYNPTTGVWSNMNSLMASSGDEVDALAVEADGNVIVAGTFLNGGGSTVGARRIARYNPTTGAWSCVGPNAAAGGGLNSTVNALAILPNGDIIAGGSFSAAAGVPAELIARYNATTGWSTLNTGLTGGSYVQALAVLPGGDVVAGGSFNNGGGVAVVRIGRFNFATNLWSSMGVGVNNEVDSLALLPVGDVVAVGLFTNQGTRIARYTWGGAAPTIAAHPAPAAACPGGVATFTATPAGTSPFACQWQWQQGAGPWTPTVNGLNSDGAGQPLFDATGALTSSLSIDPPAAATTYPVIHWDVPLNHRCVVTNACSSITSDAARLFIDPADVGVQGGLPGHDALHDNNDFVIFLDHFFNLVSDADLGRQGGLLGSDGLFDNNDFVVFLDRFFAPC